jgi:hypothetical protein
MLFKEIIAVYSENHTKHINIKCKSYWLLKQAGHIVTPELRVKILSFELLTASLNKQDK